MKLGEHLTLLLLLSTLYSIWLGVRRYGV